MAGLLVWALGQGRTAYTGAATSLLSAPKGANLGSLTPGTRVAVLKEQAGFSQVQLQGWSPQGGATALFEAKGQRILLASFTGKVQRRVRGQGKDEGGTVWEQVEVVGWVPKGALIADVNTLWKQAGALYQQRCSTCHALPETAKFTANQWPPIMRGMGPRSGLTAEQTQLLTRYAQAHAKR